MVLNVYLVLQSGWSRLILHKLEKVVRYSGFPVVELMSQVWYTPNVVMKATFADYA